MVTSTPIATLGGNVAIAEQVQALLLPDFDVVHGCYDVASAEAELPLICGGQLDTPCQSGKGSNVGRPAGERRVPEIVYFGGVVSDEEVEKLTAAIQEKAPNARFVRIKREDVVAAGAPGPVPEVIAQIFRAKVASL